MRRAASGRDTGGQRKGARLPRFGLLVYRGSAASGRLGGGVIGGSSGKGWGLGRREGRGRQDHMLGGLRAAPESPARGGRRARFEKARKFSSFPRLPPPPPLPFQAPGKAQNPEL